MESNPPIGRFPAPAPPAAPSLGVSAEVEAPAPRAPGANILLTKFDMLNKNKIKIKSN